MKKTKKPSLDKEHEKQITKIEKRRERELKELDKKILEEKISLAIQFFENQGKMVTREEAIVLLEEMEGHQLFKEYQTNILPLIEKNSRLESEIESLQSLIEKEKKELTNIKNKLRKFSK